jgi:hypothetical protein
MKTVKVVKSYPTIRTTHSYEYTVPDGKTHSITYERDESAKFTFDNLYKWIQEGRDKYERQLARNTRAIFRGDPDKPESDDFIAIHLHRTDVVKILRNGNVIFNSGGYRTATIRNRMCQFNPHGIIVYQKNYVWSINDAIPFRDNIEINADGEEVPKQFCISCKKWHYVDITVDNSPGWLVEDSYICGSCHENKYTHCSTCGDITHNIAIHELDDDPICKKCLRAVLQKLFEQYQEKKKLRCDLNHTYNASRAEYGWQIKPFGQQIIWLGKTAVDAIEMLENLLN